MRTDKEVIDSLKNKLEGYDDGLWFWEDDIKDILYLYKQSQDKCIELATTIDALQTDLKEEKEKNKNLINGIKELSKEIDDACSDDGWWYIDKLDKLLRGER